MLEPFYCGTSDRRLHVFCAFASPHLKPKHQPSLLEPQRDKTVFKMKRFLLLLFLTVTTLTASAYDFEVDGIYYNKTSDSTVEVTGYEKFNNYADSGAVVIPSLVYYGGQQYSVTSIGWYAFSDEPSLTNISIPNSITIIRNYAFMNCTGLTCITIPNSVTEIGFGAFYNCIRLKSITIPKSITSIMDRAFDKCYNVKELIYAEGCTRAMRTGLPSIERVIIPISVMSIDYCAFYNCQRLKSFTIPSSVTSIRKWAFKYCDSLTSFSFSDSEKGCTLEQYALDGFIKSMYVGRRVENLKCNSLENLTIGRKVAGSMDFSALTNLKKVASRITDPTQLVPTFAGTTYQTATLYVPEGTKADYQEAEGWKDFYNIQESADLTGIETLPTDNTDATPAKYYDLQGKQRDELQRGVNIVRQADGSSRKVYEK